jgi:phosphoglycerate dehydrogenase-like enzyme
MPHELIRRIRFEEGRRIICISDIHGHLSYFNRLLEKTSFSSEDRLIIIGDIIENGPDCLGTLRRAMQLKANGNCEVLAGNFPTELVQQLPSLKWVQASFAGVDRLCAVKWANEDAILTNSSGAFGIAIAEYMLTGLMMLFRLMPDYAANQHNKVWQRAGQCRTLWGSTVTVLGMGDIGSRFARLAKAMGATVRGVRRTQGPTPTDYDEVYTSDRLAEAVTNVDAVIMALPGTPATRHMVNEEIIARMDKRTIIVNCGRGATLDESALIAALQQGRLAGAVLDVAEVEPLPQDSPLWHMENVIITPHISGRNEDTINGESIYRIVAENLGRYGQGLPLGHVVDRKIGY